MEVPPPIPPLPLNYQRSDGELGIAMRLTLAENNVEMMLQMRAVSQQTIRRMS